MSRSRSRIPTKFLCFVFMLTTLLATLLWGIPTTSDDSAGHLLPVAQADPMSPFANIAAGHRCATHEPTKLEIAQVEDALVDYQRTVLQRSSIACTAVTVPVCWHEIRSGATGNITDADIDVQLNILNNALPGYTFLRDNSCRTDTNNPTWFNASRSFVDSTIKPALGFSTTTHLNIYSLNLDSGSSLGYSTFPWDLDAVPLEDGVGILWSTMMGVGGLPPYNLGDTLTHEVGHWLGLRHIWGDGGCSIDDFVSDTPVSDASNFGCPMSHQSCGSTDDIFNFMDYTDDSCMNSFSTGQLERSCLMNSVYRPKLQLRAPVCGNNIVDIGEDCDDGGRISGDGCSSSCQLEGLNQVCESFTPTVSLPQTIAGESGQVCTLVSFNVPTIGAVGTVNDVNISVAGTHSWVSDLSATLTSPMGSGALLFEGQCGNDNDFNLLFDDEAAASTISCPINAGATVASQGSGSVSSGSLSDFIGEDMSGTWSLYVCDDNREDGGTLTNAELEVCTYAEKLAVSVSSFSAAQPTTNTHWVMGLFITLLSMTLLILRDGRRSA